MAYTPWLDGMVTRTTIYGEDGTGTYRPVKVDNTGALLSSVVVNVPPVTAVTSAVASAAPPVYGEGTTNPLSMDLNGQIRIAGVIVATNPSVSTITDPVPASATYLGMNVGGNLVGVTGSVSYGLLVDVSRVQGTVTTKETKTVAATVTKVGSSTSNVTLAIANSSRLALTVLNDSAAMLYVKLGATATTDDFSVKLFPNALYEVPSAYAGRIDGIWASVDGNARVTEM